jgi:multidrug resistance efflux pump
MSQSPILQPGSSSWNRFRGAVARTVPVLAWLAMIALAYYLHQQRGPGGAVTGYAQDNPVTLSHLQPGAVRALHVSLHERVHPGQVVVTMDDSVERARLSTIEKDIERLASEVEAEGARLQMAEAGDRRDAEDLARRFLVDRETAHVEYLTTLVDDAHDRMLLRGARVEYDILEDLHEQGNAQFREVNDQQTVVESLAATIEENKALLQRQKLAFDDADRRWFLYRDSRTGVVEHDAVLTPLRLAVEVRRRELDELVQQIDSRVLRAPITGQISAVFAHAGDRVPAGSPLVRISPTATDRAVLYLPEYQAGLAAVGMPVDVRRMASLSGSRTPLTGRIESLASSIIEVPLRYRPAPDRPAWGRAAVVALNDGVMLMPGEAVSVSFLP